MNIENSLDSKPPVRSRLLALPPEIRELIFRFSMAPTSYMAPINKVGNRSIILGHSHPDLLLYPENYRTEISWPLLQTCKQIPHEALDGLYRYNTLTITYNITENLTNPKLFFTRAPYLVQHYWLRVIIGN